VSIDNLLNSLRWSVVSPEFLNSISTPAYRLVLAAHFRRHSSKASGAIAFPRHRFVSFVIQIKDPASFIHVAGTAEQGLKNLGGTLTYQKKHLKAQGQSSGIGRPSEKWGFGPIFKVNHAGSRCARVAFAI